MTALIIDNSEDIIERLEEILAETKMISTIFTAVSFEKAVRLYKDYQPEIVILDCGLPNDDAVHLLRMIKESAAVTSVIMIYIFKDPENEARYRLLGADFFCDLYHDYELLPGIIQVIAAEKNNDSSSYN